VRLPDVNVLIYAHREDAPEHDRYAAWLRGLTVSHEPFALSDVVLAAFLRIVTNPRIFDSPTPMDTAIAFCQRLVDWPRASLIADAYIAALAIEHGCELITTDGDFARFSGLRWRHPLAASQ
jgi:predicted nucleic acid-binding protein